MIERDNADLNVHPRDQVIVYRQLFGKTDKDKHIEGLAIPNKPLWLNIMVRMIRYYQRNISKKLGNRCVFDPSCSHYAEMAIRKKGIFKGTIITLKRLCRCRPVNGGVDEV